MNKFYRNTFVFVMMMLMCIMVNAQQRVVTGTIKDQSGIAIPGVNVLLKGTSVGTTTDVEGNFSISASSEDVLVFSFIGYTSEEVPVGNQTKIEVNLSEDISTLSEVVVVGYGVQKKVLNTGANLQVTGEDLQKLSTTNALQALQGQAPGVQITSTSGQPGEALKVIIRGIGTNGNSGPLYVVDGVLTGDISFLNPADIQSIDVLKDAASAAIYGSQAANGVVLVTTRKGKSGHSQITFDSYYGVQNVAKKLPMLNAEEYAVIMNEASVNSGKAPYFNDSQMASLKNGATDWSSPYLSNDQVVAMKGGTNWLDKMFVKNAPTQNYVLGATGGNDISTYSTSISYLSQTGVVGGRDYSNYERYNFRFNSEHKLYKNVIRVGQNLNFAYVENNGIGVGGQYNNSIRPALQASPFLPMYGTDGKFWDNSTSKWTNAEANPYAQMVVGNQNRNNNQKLLGNFYIEANILKNLKFKTSLGLDYNANEGHSFTPVYKLSIYSYNDTTKVSQYMGKGRTLIWDNLLTYNFDLADDHHFEVLVGSSAYQGRGTSISGSNYNLSFNSLDNAYLTNSLNTSNAARMSISGAPYDDDNRLSYFARVHYNLRETYLLNATFRSDASSNFAKGHRWGYFPSVSAGWVLSNESFLSAYSSTIDYLKLRASWGRVGNRNVGAFQYIAPVSFGNAGYPFGTSEGSVVAGAYQPRLSNPNLKWETSEQTDIGLDARFINGKLSATLDWYKKTTKDWIIQAPVLATAGADAPYINGGNVVNKGIEASLSYTSDLGALHYTIGANGAYNHNEVQSIPNADGIIHGSSGVIFDNSSEFNRVQQGFPVGYFWGYRTKGIFQNEGEVNSYTNSGGEIIQPNAKPGDLRYVDINDDGVIDDKDKTMLGSPIPKYTFGFNVQLRFKGFDLGIQASGVYGNKIVQSYRNVAGTFSNYSTQILDRWHGEGTSNTVPRVDLANSNWLNFSDLYIQDGAYLRINNVTLGYDLSKLVKAKALNQCRLYASALNLFTFTKYNGMDPEIGYGNASWSSGIDVGYYPRPRTFLVGLNVKF
jgi:TonB-dependent starch-binding outer membrane protein SusC